MAIGTETTVCGIVLHPAGHTRSPAMHNAAFAACGIDAAYHAFDVPPEYLGDALRGMRALGIHQLAVSIPHKEAVIAHLDRVDETARAIGAVNTVTLGSDGELVGTNTDWIGGLRAIEREIQPQGRRAVVLGAGGAARGLVYALGQAGAEVWVLNRTQSRAAELAEQLGAAGSGGLDELSDREAEIIVNTTSVGLGSDESPVDPRAIHAGAVVMDAVYVPEQTRLLADAAARGAVGIAGKWMLVYQAAEQFCLWTGREAPTEIMANAFDREADA